MAKKLHRKRSRVFHKRDTRVLKALGWVLAAVILIPASFFGAKYMMEYRPPQAPVSSAPVSNTPVSTAPEVSPPPVSDADAPLRAVYLPLSVLKESAALDSVLTKAAAAGYNGVVFDVKGADGYLQYASTTPLAAESGVTAPQALTKEQLTALMTAIKSKGLRPAPRMFAFQDPVAPHRITGSKITLQNGTTWLDNSYDQGGKAWLNPYAAPAQQYLTALAEELHAMGADRLLLDGVQFPNQTAQAYYGAPETTTKSKAEILTLFIQQIKTVMGNGRVWVCAPGKAVLGENTIPFGGNPLTFGMQGIVPHFLPLTPPYDTFQASIAQIDTRMQVMNKDTRPAVTLWIQAHDNTAADIQEQLRLVNAQFGKDASYILYAPTGTYDWTELTK